VTAADGWDSLGRPESELYRGARLEAALEFQQTGNPDLTVVETAFLEESSRRAESEVRALAERARREERQNRRLRALLVAAAILVVSALAAGVMAWRGQSEATRQRDVARSAQDDAEIESLVNRSLALRSTNRDVAALLAVEAARRWPGDARATSALFGTFTAADGFIGHRYVDGATRLGAGALVGGTTTAIVAIDGTTLASIDLQSGHSDRRFAAAPEHSYHSVVRVSDDGRYVAQLLAVDRSKSCGNLETMVDDDDEGCAALAVYDVGSGDTVLGPITPPVGPGDVAINSDGSLVAVTGGYEGMTIIYRVVDGAEVGRLTGEERPSTAFQTRDTAAVAFGTDGRLYVGSLAGPIRVVDPESFEVESTLDVGEFSSNQAIVPAGELVVVAGDQGMAAFDAVDGRVRWTADLRGRDATPCPWFAASAAAGFVYCGDNFGVIREWDLETGHPTGRTLDPALGDVGALSVSSNGRELVAFGADKAAISRWRLDGSGLITRHVAGGYLLADGWNPAGDDTIVVARRTPATTTFDDVDDFALWDTARNRLVDDLDYGTVALGIGWVGPDLLIAHLPSDERFGLYDSRLSKPTTNGVSESLTCDRWLPAIRGLRTFCLMTNGDVATIDPATGQQIAPTIHVDGYPDWVSATSDLSLVAVSYFTSNGGVTTLHDSDTGAQHGPGLEGPGLGVVSPDGLLVAATGGELARYDTTTMQPIQHYPGARGAINLLQFSDDGRTLLATSLDQTVSVYDVASGTRLGDPIGVDAPFSYPGYLRPDGHEVAVTDATGVSVWDLDPEHLAEAACQLAGRNLTRTEWATYLNDVGTYRRTCPDYV
jgi:WD40 repeat protein